VVADPVAVTRLLTPLQGGGAGQEDALQLPGTLNIPM